ncbi:MAG TPA: PaaI family thioesterase [Acidimicrobiia bacterium]|jgi:acyl-coenzyme A thioesterase PaaI-like protein
MTDSIPDDAFAAHEARRVEVAGALRELVHAYVGHEHDDATLDALRDWARSRTAELRAGAPRDRASVMRRASPGLPPAEWRPAARAGFEDRAVAGHANPTSIEYQTWRDGDVMYADITLDSAFEGAPGRAHGGIVAAAFDDFTGAVIGMIQEPAFTGELTVRFVRPVPVHKPLRFRTWLESRDGRKLYINAEAHDGDTLVATCHATYITVDPAIFAQSPDPR